MEQILLHLIGDYIIQNHWMSVNKVKNTIIGYLSCFIHCLTYSLPFLYLTNGFTLSWFIIFLTHFLIDKYRLAVYLIKFKNWEWNSKNHGFNENTPIWLSTWLMIIIDNILHLIINYLALKI